MNTEIDTDKSRRYLNDAKARERVEDSEYEHMLNKPIFKKHRRDLELRARIDDTLDDILKKK